MIQIPGQQESYIPQRNQSKAICGVNTDQNPTQNTDTSAQSTAHNWIRPSVESGKGRILDALPRVA
ncbi:uncharacterized protein N7511_002174 [Penicillium nucicola]|uniref:uncharacterized protein n=1 Tax=Penicillium nucicola TaxID=1850975 RepID=UPI002545715A|nr:uncharacterized protein N7511_002174 [Penicillium nucicola]KAJ5770123.1 hypothetical protein N7511_002174 [Penicillium nucicola]